MIKTFEEFDNDVDIDPYGEEDWIDSELKEGDTVICVDDNGYKFLKKFDKYTITEIDKDGNEIFILIKDKNNIGSRYYYDATRFIKK